MPRRHLSLLLVTLSLGGCAEIEFGVGAGGEQAGGGPLAGNNAGGSAPTGEQCLNGTDDDNDGLADCADDDCADVGCVEIPLGWLGPVELRPDDSPCDGAFSAGIASLKNKVEAPPASCACSCTGVPQTCDAALLQQYTSAGCNNLIAQEELQASTCEALSDGQITDGFDVEPDVIAGGCSNSVETSLEPATFEARRLCGLPGDAAGCDSGSCAPSATCVYMPGEVVCPSGFADPFTGSAGIVDTRDCDADSCGCNASGSSCSFLLEIYANQDCSGDVIASTTSTNCTPVGGGGSNNRGVLYTATPGTVDCTSSGAGTPVGGVEPNEPITVCCAL